MDRGEKRRGDCYIKISISLTVMVRIRESASGDALKSTKYRPLAPLKGKASGRSLLTALLLTGKWLLTITRARVMHPSGTI